MSNSSLATFTRLSPNKTSPRKNVIDTITIHCAVGQLTAQQIVSLSNFVNYSSIKGCSCNYAVGKDGSIALCVEEKDRSWCSSSASNDNRAITIEVASDTTHPYAITDKAMDALIKLCADICKRNDIKALKWSDNKSDRKNHINGVNMTCHRDFANKACPGDYIYNKEAYIANEVNKLIKSNTTIQPTPTVAKSTFTIFVEKVQDAIGAKVDGIVGNETLSKTVTISKTKNRKHKVVKVVQERLIALGYSCGKCGADGDFGKDTELAVKSFQRDNKCYADGEITARQLTWKKLLKYNG